MADLEKLADDLKAASIRMKNADLRVTSAASALAAAEMEYDLAFKEMDGAKRALLSLAASEEKAAKTPVVDAGPVAAKLTAPALPELPPTLEWASAEPIKHETNCFKADYQQKIGEYHRFNPGYMIVSREEPKDGFAILLLKAVQGKTKETK